MSEKLKDMAEEVAVDSVKAGLEQGKEVLLAQLRKKSFYEALVRGLNKSIDVPFIGEDTEETILRSILDICIEALEEIDFDGED